MKKIALLVVASLVVLLLVMFGPSLLGIYRLQHYVSASAESYQADGGDWPHLTDVCMGCHGVKGNSLHQGYPSLAGQPALYVAAQLHAFASARRSNPTMGPLAMTISAAQVKLLSDYYSRQSPEENRYFRADPQLRLEGEQLVKGGTCTACHGARLTGQAQFPRLAGQGYGYLIAQLDAFAAGTRIESTGTMKRVAEAMTSQERKAVATYLASLNPNTK
jgi:cytochrome c553